MLAADRMKQFESGIFQLLNDKKKRSGKGREKGLQPVRGNPRF